MRQIVTTLCILCIGIIFAASAFADDEGDAKYSIKDVMKQAHGKKLLNKVLDGGATTEEKAKLLDLYLSLLENTPSKGDEDAWHLKAGAVVVAAAKVAVGREGAEAELKTATSCAACHKAHK